MGCQCNGALDENSEEDDDALDSSDSSEDDEEVDMATSKELMTVLQSFEYSHQVAMKLK